MYSYEKEKPWLFTEDGFRQFVKHRDIVLAAIPTRGCVRGEDEIICLLNGNTFSNLAILDRMVELGDLDRDSLAKTGIRVFVRRSK